MEKLQRLARSLKSARSYELPQDPKPAYYMLLSYVMQNQHRTFIDLLGTSSSFDLNFVCGKSKRTLLHMAANVGAYDCLCYLLKRGAQPNVSDRQGITPLQVAARNGFVRCITKLLEHEADIEIKNNEGMTAIHWLASNGRTEVFSEIMNYISNVDVKDDNQQTPLHVACLNGHKMTVVKLIEMKADIESENIWGRTPLYFACRHGHSEVVQVLLQYGATLKCDCDGDSPIDAALKGGYSRVCYAIAEWNPNSIKSILQSCQKEEDVEKINTVLSYMMSQNISFRDLILHHVSQVVHNEGLKLLSQSSDYAKTSEMFLKNVKVLTYLLSFNPRTHLPSQNGAERSRADHMRFRLDSARSRIDSTRSRVEVTRTSDLLDQYENEPRNVGEITAELNNLWSILESWMCFLQDEVSQKHDVNHQHVNSTVVKSDSANLHSFASNLKTEASNYTRQVSARFGDYSSQASRNSLNIHDLMRRQPALQYTFPDDDDSHSTNVCHTSGDYKDGGNSSEFTMDGAESESFVASSRQNEDIEAENDAQIICSNDTSSTDQTNSINTSNSAEFDIDREKSSSKENESAYKLMDLTGERICALIHGYYLNSQCLSLWKSMSGKMSSFNKFVKRYEEVLILLVSRKPEVIFEHFNFILENPFLLRQFLPAIHSQPLAERRKWFYERLNAGKSKPRPSEDWTVNIDRDSLLETSCKVVSDKDGDTLKENLSVRFHGEEGMGAGVTREWFDLLVKEILNPDCALFTLSADGSTFQPNCNSSINPDHLSYFQFAGRIMGLALYHKHLITAYFARSFYKHILGVPVSYADVESIDPEYSKNLQWILDNSIDNLGLDITFAVETDVFGQTKEVELKPNGKNILVTDDNKFEYVHLAADLRMTNAIKKQMSAFLKGFYEFIPHKLVSLFNEYELELLLSGVPDVDIDDWKKNTTYQAGFTPESPTIQWFWEAVSTFSKEEQIQLLQFVTGTSRVPWGGFSNLSGVSGSLFTICRVEGKSESLPTASTCFNLMKLPEYNSKEDVVSKLRTAIACGSLGFEFT